MAKQTSPLAKAITTLEGQLVIASDVVIGAGAAIDPHVLPPKIAAIVVAAQHIALLVQRGVIKAQHSPAVTALVDSQNVSQALSEVDRLASAPAVSGAPPTTPTV